MSAGRIESLRIRGFRSLADVDLSNLGNANVLIGPNGSGKSNFIRLFEMLSWMLRLRRLGEFIGTRGGADDQLSRGKSVTPGMDAQLALRTEAGRIEYRFALAHADPDRFVFSDEAFRCTAELAAEAPWQHVASGQPEGDDRGYRARVAVTGCRQGHRQGHRPPLGELLRSSVPRHVGYVELQETVGR